MDAPIQQVKARSLTRRDTLALVAWIAISCWALRRVAVAAAQGVALIASGLLGGGPR
jgi:hypothetical protein